MKRAIASILAVILACPGCAVRLGGRPASPLLHGRGMAVRQPQPVRPPDPAVWYRYLGSIPVGCRVKVETTDRKSFKGIFMGVEGGNVVVKPRTRIPEPARTIAIPSLASLELDQGMGAGKVVAIAAGVAGATVLTIFFVLLSIND
jgi:hypothetical protein